MSCEWARAIDMSEYVADPTSVQWEGFRQHFPDCEECSQRLAEWTGLEQALREKAGALAGHPEVETLVALQRAPDSVSPVERSRLEVHLAACRSCADEAAALRAYDFSKLGRPAESGAVEALRRVGRSLQDLVPALLGRGGEHEGGGLFGPEPQIVFQSSDAAAGPEPGGRPLVAVLAGLQGDLDGQVFRLVAGENRIGRAPECEIRLTGDVSRVEATIREAGGRFEVISGNRRRAVRVNDSERESSELADGDRLQVGGQRFQFRVVGGPG